MADSCTSVDKVQSEWPEARSNSESAAKEITLAVIADFYRIKIDFGTWIFVPFWDSIRH
jgi:hypothetical protein